MGRHQKKQNIDSVISSSLTAWLLNFGPEIHSANQITWFFNLNISRMAWSLDYIFDMTV